MDGSKKNKYLLFGLIGFVVLLLAIGGFFVLSSNNGGSEPEETEQAENENIKQLTADDLGLTLTPTQNNQVIELEITNLDGVESIDYEVSYDAEENGEVVPRGVIGSAELEPGETSITRKIDLGTCSRNVCKYDEGVEKVMFVMRVNFSDGSVGELEEELVLE